MSPRKTKKFSGQRKKKSEAKKNRGLFAEAHAVAPAPSRDYYALQVYQKKFLWTRWKISHGPYANPLQRVVSLDEFAKDVTMQNEITYIFGSDTTSLINDLAREYWSLTTMPCFVLQKIISYVSVPDILRLSQVCKRLSKECSKNDLWQSICKKQWKILLHNDVEKAGLIGWKKVYLEKMRPKKSAGQHHTKPGVLQRTRTTSASTLTTPQPTPKSKRQENTVRTSSEIFTPTSGKSTIRPFSRESKPPKPKNLNQSSHSLVNLLPLIENPEKETVRKSKSPRTTKCKVTSIRTRSVTSQSIQPTEVRNSKVNFARPGSGKVVKGKQ